MWKKKVFFYYDLLYSYKKYLVEDQYYPQTHKKRCTVSVPWLFLHAAGSSILQSAVTISTRPPPQTSAKNRATATDTCL